MTKPSARMWRRPKADPKSDFWHTIRVGIALACVIWIIVSLVAGAAP